MLPVWIEAGLLRSESAARSSAWRLPTEHYSRSMGRSMKNSGPPQRKTYLKRSNKPLRKSGPTKAKKVARQRVFYASAVWKRLRKEALERARHQCEYIVNERDSVACCCSSIGFRCDNTEHLEVHHQKGSSRFGGNELPEDLQVLCGPHHHLTELRDFPHRHPRQRVA